MKRVETLLKDAEFKEKIEKLIQLEQNRIYCKHGLEHLLAVARISYICNLEDKIGLDKEMIYLASLLHDLGRVEEYEEGISHHESGAISAEYFLNKLNYPVDRAAVIVEAIRNHRDKSDLESVHELESLLKKADIQSRNCGYCKQYQTCKWSIEKKEHAFMQ